MADILPQSPERRDRLPARRNSYAIGGGALILIMVAFPLLREFVEPGHAAWNLFLVTFLIGIVVAGVLLQRFFVAHAGEIGEARFDTRNKSDLDG
jgi:Na+/melibiose symporter-like transporter